MENQIEFCSKGWDSLEFKNYFRHACCDGMHLNRILTTCSEVSRFAKNRFSIKPIMSMKKIHTITFQYVETGHLCTMRTENPQHYTKFAGHPEVNVVLIKASVAFEEEKPAHKEHGFKHYNFEWGL